MPWCRVCCSIHRLWRIAWCLEYCNRRIRRVGGIRIIGLVCSVCIARHIICGGYYFVIRPKCSRWVVWSYSACSFGCLFLCMVSINMPHRGQSRRHRRGRWHRRRSAQALERRRELARLHMCAVRGWSGDRCAAYGWGKMQSWCLVGCVRVTRRPGCRSWHRKTWVSAYNPTPSRCSRHREAPMLRMPVTTFARLVGACAWPVMPYIYRTKNTHTKSYRMKHIRHKCTSN